MTCLMAKIRVKQGDNEIEIDSRDFYVDNDSAAEVIESFDSVLGGFSAETDGVSNDPRTLKPSGDCLNRLTAGSGNRVVST